MLKIWYLIPIVIILDQVTKFLAISNIGVFEQVTIIPGVLSFTHVLNSGAFLGIFSEHNNLLSITATIIICGLFVFLWLRGTVSRLLRLAIVLTVGGAIGNVIDRLVHNAVVDFIKLDFINFPVFNLADMFITAGAIMMIWNVLTTNHKEEDNHEN